MTTDGQIIKRDFATPIPSETRNRWNEIKFKFPRVTRQIHIVAHTKLSKPVIIRAMIDNMATQNTLTKIDEFFNQINNNNAK